MIQVYREFSNYLVLKLNYSKGFKPVSLLSAFDLNPTVLAGGCLGDF